MANEIESGESVQVEQEDDFNLPLTANDEPGPGQDRGQGAGKQVDAAAQDQPQADTAADSTDYPAELIDQFQREGLRFSPGETATQAYNRLVTHLAGKSARTYKDFKRMREENQRSLDHLSRQLEPMLRDYYRQQHQAEVEQIAAQIPDPETDPTGYQIWLQEEILRQNEEARKEKETAEERRLREETERATIRRLSEIDERGYAKVNQGLGLVDGIAPDPDFTIAFDLFSQSAMEAARAMFPTAEDALIEEFVALSQQKDIRLAEVNGYDFREVMKQRLNGIIDGLVQMGVVVRVARGNGNAATGATGAATASNGNGNSAAKTALPAKPNAAAGRTTAQRVTADAAAAARRAPSAVPSTTRPSAAPGQLPDTADMDEDQYVEAALAQLLGNEEQRASSVNRRGR